MMLAEIDTILMLRFTLENMRCYGGPGWQSQEAPVLYPSWPSLIELLSS